MSGGPHSIDAFRHEAFLYAGDAEFVDGTGGFIRDGLAAGEPVLAVLSARKIDMLREDLGATADTPLLRFADMADVGSNPARIIPAWRDFVDQNGGGRVRGIGEPIWAERTGAVLAECERHEALLNTAFDGGRPWWLLCPYDTRSLPAEVLERAWANHPYVGTTALQQASTDYRAPDAFFDGALTEPSGSVVAARFDVDSLGVVRWLASRQAALAGLPSPRIADFALAANEVATNSVRHGGGSGEVRVWQDAGAVVCEVRDAGVIDRPLVDRLRPGVGVEAPRGLWLANQLCDLVQLRTSPAGTVVRLHLVLGGQAG